MKKILPSIWCAKKIIISLFLPLVLAACGGGGSSTTPITPLAKNVVAIGSDGLVFGATNGLFVDVTLCSPVDPSLCITVDHVLVDTGSTGLRIFAQPQTTAALAALSLTQQTSGSVAVGECMPFASGVTWGSIKKANIKIGGESASNVAIQVMADPAFNPIPASCSSQGIAVMGNPTTFGANGVLGIGLTPTDCAVCTTVPSSIYYTCGVNCSTVTMPLVDQVQNPVTLFAPDNNGVIISLNAISNLGAPSATGTLTFGVDTSANNASSNTNVIKVNNSGNFSAVFNGQTYPTSFIDSGSNGYFFATADPAFLACGANAPGFYCPTNPISLNALITGGAGSTAPATVVVNVGNPTNLFVGQNYVFNNLAGASFGAPGVFDFGLPFFFGKNVSVVMAGSSSAKGSGPYVGW